MKNEIIIGWFIILIIIVIFGNWIFNSPDVPYMRENGITCVEVVDYSRVNLNNYYRRCSDGENIFMEKYWYDEEGNIQSEELWRVNLA